MVFVGQLWSLPFNIIWIIHFIRLKVIESNWVIVPAQKKLWVMWVMFKWFKIVKAGTICHPIDCDVRKSQPGAFLTSAQAQHSNVQTESNVQLGKKKSHVFHLPVTGTMESSDREGTLGSVADVGDFQTLVTSIFPSLIFCLVWSTETAARSTTLNLRQITSCWGHCRLDSIDGSMTIASYLSSWFSLSIWAFLHFHKFSSDTQTAHRGLAPPGHLLPELLRNFCPLCCSCLFCFLSTNPLLRSFDSICILTQTTNPTNPYQSRKSEKSESATRTNLADDSIFQHLSSSVFRKLRRVNWRLKTSLRSHEKLQQ